MMTLRQKYFEQFSKNCEDAVKLTETKNKGYTGGTNDPFKNFRFAAELASLPGKEPITVEQTILSRCADKLSRLKSLLVRPDYATNDESILDTMRDLFVYSNILLIYLQLGRPNGDVEYRDDLGNYEMARAEVVSNTYGADGPYSPISYDENGRTIVPATTDPSVGQKLAAIFGWGK
jgi:hypothetical protein